MLRADRPFGRPLTTLSAFLVVVLAPNPAVSQTLQDRVDSLERRIAELQALHNVAQPPRSDSEHLRWGIPVNRGVLLDKEFFVISHDNDRKVAEWVAYRLNPANLEGTARRRDNFRADPDLAAGDRSTLADYRGSGFDRGHMAPAAAFRRSTRAMSTTFVLSNMAPQTGRLNRHIWARLESQVRDLARAHGDIWVFTGPLYLDANGNPTTPTRFIGPSDVAVPTHFFKAILCQHDSGTRETFGFILPNSSRRISGTPADFMVAVDEVERLAGFDLFAALADPEENRLEARIATAWPIIN